MSAARASPSPLQRPRSATVSCPPRKCNRKVLAFRPSAWLEVRPDNIVIVTVSKSEMGQGVYTSLPMIVADELDADWKNVRMESAPAGDAYKDPAWGTQSTGGSSSIRHMYEPLRLAGAAAREMLLQAASKEWKVAITECAVSLGTVRHIRTSRMLTYGQLVEKASKLSVPQKPVLKKETQFRYIGKEVRTARYSRKSERDRKIRHRLVRAGYALCSHRPSSCVSGRPRFR